MRWFEFDCEKSYLGVRVVCGREIAAEVDGVEVQTHWGQCRGATGAVAGSAARPQGKETPTEASTAAGSCMIALLF